MIFPELGSFVPHSKLPQFDAGAVNTSLLMMIIKWLMIRRDGAFDVLSEKANGFRKQAHPKWVDVRPFNEKKIEKNGHWLDTNQRQQRPGHNIVY